ncbi:MAG: cell division protein FtsA [bacterium]|nr:cell division protein FtsA [bacterium]
MKRKGTSDLIVGLDIGSSAIRLAVGQLVETGVGGGRELQIIGVAETASEGVHKGTVGNIEDTVSSVSACLEKLERLVGVPIETVWLGVPGVNASSQISKGVIAVSKADNEITREDIERGIESVRSLSAPLNYSILHIIPQSFSVDGQPGISDPVGMTGIRLEVDARVMLAPTSQVGNFTRSVHRAGLEINGVVLSSLAMADAVLTSKQKELGVAVINFGGSTTGLSVYEEGNMIHTVVLPIGSENITNDIAIVLRVSIDIAERIKVELGSCFAEAVSKKEELDLYDFGATNHEGVKRVFLSQIIEARVEDILQKIDQELKKIQRSGLLPAGVVIIGGGAKLPGMVELSKKVLRLPSTLGYPLNIGSVTEKINDLGFSTVIGLVKWGSHNLEQSGTRHPILNLKGAVGSMLGRLKAGFSNLIP